MERPQRYWTLMLNSVIEGKAQQTCSALSATQAEDCNVAKTSLLTAYKLVSDAHQQKASQLDKSSQNHMEFAHEKEVFFEKWCASESVRDDFGKLQMLILVEEFMRCTKDDIRSYLNER